MLQRAHSLHKITVCRGVSTAHRQQEILHRLEKDLGIESEGDWYRVSHTQLLNLGLLKDYGNSRVQLAKALYPDYPWQEWEWKPVPKGFWTEPEHQRKYLTWLGGVLGFETSDDWHKLTTDDLLRHKGGSLLRLYGGSVTQIIRSVFSEREWCLNKFPGKRHRDINIGRSSLGEVGKTLKVKTYSDWYEINKPCMVRHGLGSLLKHHQNSPWVFLQFFYSNYNWRPWEFLQAPKNIWSSTKNQRLFLDSLGKKLGFSRWEDWYQVSFEQMTNNEGRRILSSAGWNKFMLLSNAYPEFNWSPFRFERTSNKEWEDDKHFSHLLRYIEEELRISNPNDWYRVSNQQLQSLGILQWILNRGGLASVLERYRPERTWERKLFSLKNKKATQRWLKEMVKELFPEVAIVEEHYHPDLILSNPVRKMRLDVFIPELKVAFEYQGYFHYHDAPEFLGPLETRQAKDEDKRQKCQEVGIKLIEVPYTWDNSLEELKSIVRREYPELLTH